MGNIKTEPGHRERREGVLGGGGVGVKGEGKYGGRSWQKIWAADVNHEAASGEPSAADWMAPVTRTLKRRLSAATETRAFPTVISVVRYPREARPAAVNGAAASPRGPWPACCPIHLFIAGPAGGEKGGRFPHPFDLPSSMMTQGGLLDVARREGARRPPRRSRRPQIVHLGQQGHPRADHDD